MPSKSTVFTAGVEPVSPPYWAVQNPAPHRNLVEAPGTAPGSAPLIPRHVYRHSWQASKNTIRFSVSEKKD